MKNKGMYRLLSGVLCTSVLLSSQVYAAAPADYSDFPQNWSKDAMEFAVKNNFITGVSEDKIAPKAALTRAQLAAILSRVMKTGAGDVSVLDHFNDADKNAWYAGSMAKAVELNILYGDGDSIYPDRPVTRQELFTILVRAFSVAGGDESALAPYSDAGSVSSWARAAISAMIAQGYAAGYEDKTIRPTQQVTREEFAQLLYRMQEFYGSSDSSDDKTETKTDEPTKTDGKKTSGGGGGGSSSGGGSHSGGSTVTANKIVDEAKATVQSTDMGAWLPLVFTDGYDMSKATVTVDGADVTSAMTAVTTDGTIAKLPLTGTPKQVVIKSGDKTQTINLSGNGTASVYTGAQYLPNYVWAHGPIAAWDYYLTNYDEDGKVRVNPTRTTFSLTKEVSAHPYYSPDAEVKDSESFGHVDGNVTIMFNYNTDDEKAWFDGINKLELVAYNENRNTLNDHLTFTPAKDVAHGSGKVGELTIPIDQDNFRGNGRYYVRVRSNDGDKKSVLVPIHVVNAEKPELLLRETVASGRNLHFDVENMLYAITSPIESVTLTDPKGDTKELRNLVDYALIGDLFVLYNDETAKDGVNNIPYNGNYTITIRSNGFKEFSKSFTVEDGEDVSSKQAAVVYQSAAYDVVTHATGSSSGGGSSDGGGSYMVSADLWFDSDLLANALLLEKMDVECAAAKKVIDNWYSVICDALINQGDTNYYTYTGYLNAVNDAKLAGAKWLGYAEYIAAGDATTTLNRPASVKKVLEDGLLGDIQHSDTYGRLEAPTATIGEAKEGQDVEITFENADAYMGNITKLYLNGDWKELSTDAYTIEGNKITIKAGTLKIGENKITVDATGYLSNVVTIDYAKETEQDLSLSVATPIKEGDDVVITVTNSTKGDFLKNLTGVVLKNTDGTEKTVYHQGYEGSNAVYYVVSDDFKTITLKNVEPGTYTVSVSANYYETMTTAEFTVSRTTPLKTAPSVKAHEKQKAGSFDSTDFYRLTFSGLTGKDLDAYLGAITKVTVGDKAYTEATSIYFQDNNYRTKIVDSAYGNYKDALDLAVNGIDAVNGTQITVEAKGYEPMTYILKDGSTPVTPDPSEKAAPTVSAGVYQEAGYLDDAGKYRFTFKGMSEADLDAYLQAITEITVEGVTYTKPASYSFGENNYTIGYSGYRYYDYLELAENAFKASGETTIIVKADGYKTLTIKFDVTDPIKADAPAAAVEKLDDTTYRMTFAKADATEVQAYLNKISSGTTVKVGENTYSKAYSKSSLAAGKYWVGDSKSDYGSAYDCIDFYADGFAADAATTITIDNVEGYKKLECTYTPAGGDNGGGDNGNGGETATTAPKVKSVEQNTVSYYYEVSFATDTQATKDYLEKITKVTVGGTEYREASFGSPTGAQYSRKDFYGDIVDVLKLGDNGAFATGVTIVIEADGYENLTFTYPLNADNNGGTGDKDDNNTSDNDTVKVSECVKNQYDRYYLKFDGLDIKDFSITEVTVGGKQYEELYLLWGNSKYNKAESEGKGIDCLELSADGFNTSDDTKIVIKGTLNGKEITIEYTFTAE